jgi:hypothetical protein
MFGFEKIDLAHIKPDDLRRYRKAARIYLGYSEEEATEIVREKALFEIARSRKGVEHGKNIQERSIRGVTRKHVCTAQRAPAPKLRRIHMSFVLRERWHCTFIGGGSPHSGRSPADLHKSGV